VNDGDDLYAHSAAVIMMTPKQAVMEWAAGFNRHDVAAAAALYHYDSINIQMPIGEPVLGRESIVGAFIGLFPAFPDSCAEVEHLRR
jgi:ketosteroid isomerase-like protein